MRRKERITGVGRPYERTVSQLRERLARELADKVESIVLYGSVARGEARGDSDIDILVITRGAERRIYGRISRIRTEVDLESDTLTALVHMSRSEFERSLKMGSPFVESVVEEGIVLHDSGLFGKARRSLAGEG